MYDFAIHGNCLSLDEYAEYDPTILVVPALKNLLRRIEENERMK